jgi:hypothetical protein
MDSVSGRHDKGDNCTGETVTMPGGLVAGVRERFLEKANYDRQGSIPQFRR